jgi:hypothetical protein
MKTNLNTKKKKKKKHKNLKNASQVLKHEKYLNTLVCCDVFHIIVIAEIKSLPDLKLKHYLIFRKKI